jgi:peptidoglycan/LPS O-acetylase OafA/YrhL
MGNQTFTLYLTHQPMLAFVAAVTPWSPASWQTRLMVYVMVPALIIPMAATIEHYKPLWRGLSARLIDTATALVGATRAPARSR